MTIQLLHIARTPISHIDTENRTYSLIPFNQELNTDELCTSISHTGLLQPPIIKAFPDAPFVVVSGWQRVIAAQALGLTAVDCHIVPHTTAEIDAFAIALSEVTRQHPLSPLEKAVFFQKVCQYCTVQDAASTFLPQLGLPQNPTIINKLLLLANLEHPVAEALHNGVLDEKAAYHLLTLSFRDRLLIFEVISELRLSVSNQRKLIHNCLNLSKREGTSIQAILSSGSVQAIISHKEANPPQKSANLMAYLDTAISPRLAEAEKEFNILKQSLNLPKGAILTHSTAFEKDDLTLSLTFKNSETVKEFCAQHLHTSE